MFSQVYYLIRKREDGSYLAAHPERGEREEIADAGYLLLFREQFDALGYLNKYGADVSDRFAVESIPGIQLKGILNRWGFTGIALVEDPLLPKVEFLRQS
ncbi:hypothetical protein [Phormidium sp. CCY1219]|uniref:hypothetical protein n=1 Tax=Phormidium sp. CCY1219 TaxID=2886104 RepID=UPI002D1F7A4B|nr:hypothetical protein [Phormidium sp. CCY1219]MEB3830738.1 hypothetical protein [Phormidium sp. CCY1219]